MAFYQRIQFRKSRETSTSNVKVNNENTTASIEATSLQGNEIKEFYESIIHLKANSDMPKSSSNMCVDLEPLKSKRKGKTSHRKHTVNSFLKAAAEGDLKAVTECIRQDFDINVRDEFGWTALMCACYSGQVDVVGYLLYLGAQWVGIKDKSGNDAMELAKRATQAQIVILLRNSGNNCNSNNKESSDDNKLTEPFYCNSCNATIETSTNKEHRSSTVHQFCMQHAKQSTLYYLNDSNKGFQMMLKGGWDSESGLGPDGSGMKFPVKTTLKRDRKCLGSKSDETKPRITHFKAFDTAAIKRQKKDKEIKKPVCMKNKKYNAKKSKKMRTWEIEYRQSWNNETS